MHAGLQNSITGLVLYVVILCCTLAGGSKLAVYLRDSGEVVSISLVGRQGCLLPCPLVTPCKTIASDFLLCLCSVCLLHFSACCASCLGMGCTGVCEVVSLAAVNRAGARRLGFLFC